MSEIIPNWLKKRAYLTPDRTAIRFQKREYSFQELYERSLRVARQIHHLNVKKDAYVGVLLKNHVETVFILFALQMLGVRAVLLNNRLTERELVFQLKDSQAQLLLTEKEFVQKAEKIAEEQPELPVIFKEDLFDFPEKTFIFNESFLLNDVCTVMYTSGTTGNPKGVLQTYGNHWWSAIGSVLNLGLREDDCWLAAVPLFHISGFSILIRSVIYGITVDLHESFDEKIVNEAIINEKVSIISVVSSMLMRLLDQLQDKHYPATFRCMLLGGGPAPLPLLEACQSKNIPVFQTYGMTETSSQIVTLAPEYSLTKLGSAGKPLFPSHIRIETDNGDLAEENVAGEIVVKGPNVTSGYVNRANETTEFTTDGWFRTGDIGYVDEEGFLFILDRRSDLIISGGENIYPAEIEAVILSHPDVADVGVIGKEDVKWGQVPVAFVVLRSSATITETELQTYCQKKLAKYKVPKQITFRQELPRNAARKLLRKELRNFL